MVEAEKFDEGGPGGAYDDLTSGNSGGQFRSTDVDIEATTDVGGGYDVGWISAGEWLKFTANGPLDGLGEMPLSANATASGSPTPTGVAIVKAPLTPDAYCEPALSTTATRAFAEVP